MVKMTLTFDEETIKTLRTKAKEEGFMRPSVLARYILLRGLREDIQTSQGEEQRELRVPVNNYREIKEYVEEKQLGNVNIFAAFAMKQYMTRYPLKTSLKTQDKETAGD
jgi:hypothetical protein